MGGRLYVVGGNDNSSNLATVEIYDPASNSWTAGPPLPTARGYAAAGAIGSKLYVAGGYGPTAVEDELYVLDGECCAGVPVPQGPPGPQGPQGEPGPEGAPGLSGVQHVAGSPLTLAKKTTGTATAVCPAGRSVVGGGFTTAPASGGNDNQADVRVFSSAGSSPTTWSVSAYNDANGNLILTAYAICAYAQ